MATKQSTDSKPDVNTEVKVDEAPKPKRTMPTQAERIAALEAKLEATKAKGKEREQKQIAKLKEQRSELADKRTTLDVKIDAIDKELVALGAGPVVDGDTTDASDS